MVQQGFILKSDLSISKLYHCDAFPKNKCTTKNCKGADQISMSWVMNEECFMCQHCGTRYTIKGARIGKQEENRNEQCNKQGNKQ